MTPRTGVRAVIATAFALGLAAGGEAATATPQLSAPAASSVTTSVGEGAPGTVARLYGSGWPAKTYVQATTCGNLGVHGASDCARNGSSSRITGDDGTFVMDVVIAKPPKACPCVLHVVSVSSSVVVNQPFTVVGQPTAAVDRSTTRRTLEVSARLTGSGTTLAELTGSHRRTFTMTVRNTGTQRLVDPRVTITSGPSANPTTVLAQPRLGAIEPGGTVTYTYPQPITVGRLAAGTYTARAYFTDLDEPLAVTARTTVLPSPVAIAVAVLGVALVLLRLRSRARRARSRS